MALTETFEIHDRRFARLIIEHVRLERLWTGCRWAEGPVYIPAAKSVVWSDIPRDQVLRFDEESTQVTVFERNCGYHNGHALDRQGRIVACEHGGRRVSRLDHDGVWRTICDRVGGKRLNSPNDVCVTRDGAIWFSDPTYGIDSHYEGHLAESEIDGCFVYRLGTDEVEPRAMITDLLRPNGLAFSPDETTLYVSDTGKTHEPERNAVIRSYPIGSDGVPDAIGQDFAKSPDGLFDGFCIDEGGNLWASTATGVVVYAPDGTLVGRIPIPEIVSNLCFGGPKRNRLFITAQTSLYAVYVNVSGGG